MKKIITLLIFVLFFIPTIAEGADWELLAEFPDGAKQYIDKESIKKTSENIIRAWTKNINKKPEQFGLKKVKGGRIFLEYDCEEKKYRQLEVIVYFTDGTSKHVNPEPWNYVPAGTIAEMIYEYLCENGK